MVAFRSELGEFSITKLMILLQNLSITPYVSQHGSGASNGQAPTTLKFKNNVPFIWHPHIDMASQGIEGNQSSCSPLLVLLFGLSPSLTFIHSFQLALMTEKRVLFVGHGKPCSEVGNCVLSCIAIASGGNLIPAIAERCFPYTSLANIDNLLKAYDLSS